MFVMRKCRNVLVMSGVVISKRKRTVNALIMIGIHNFVKRQAKVNQFTKEQCGAVIKPHLAANKPNQVAALFQINIWRFDERQAGDQVEKALEILLNQFLPRGAIETDFPATSAR